MYNTVHWNYFCILWRAAYSIRIAKIRQIYSPSFKMASVDITCSLPERADEISLAKVKQEVPFWLAAIYIMSTTVW